MSWSRVPGAARRETMRRRIGTHKQQVPDQRCVTSQSSVRRLRKLICVAALRSGHLMDEQFEPIRALLWVAVILLGFIAGLLLASAFVYL